MKTLSVDQLNTGLIFISAIMAYIFPIELFVLAYAILGPLHYLTEINWINDQDYFIPAKNYWISIVLVLSLIFSVPYLLGLPIFQAFFSSQGNHIQTVQLYKEYINWSIFMSFVVALSFILLKKVKLQLIMTLIGGVLAVVLNSNSNYNLIFGVFLPTIIHVYVFTVVFMLYGVIGKPNVNLFGILNIILMLVFPLILWSLNFNPRAYSFPSYFKEIFIQIKFHHLNVFLASFLNIKKELSFYFYELIDLKIQMFIAFAYTYHYLNWFSKTTVINWHKKITTKKGIFIGGLWLLLITIYFYDYKIGFTTALFLSVLHVVLEFPLNIIVLKRIGQKVLNFKKIKSFH